MHLGVRRQLSKKGTYLLCSCGDWRQLPLLFRKVAHRLLVSRTNPPLMHSTDLISCHPLEEAADITSNAIPLVAVPPIHQYRPLLPLVRQEQLPSTLWIPYTDVEADQNAAT
jgi:hypothetical protein